MTRNFRTLFKAHAMRTNSVSYNELQHDDEIRLVVVPPGRERVAKKLVVSIEHVRLSALPLYSAISWTWGPPDQRASLDIEGQKISVPANLRRIIEQIQEEKQNRKVWIDAICINQADTKERNQQVHMMGRIYNSANYVLACLTANGNGRIGLQEDAKRLYGILRERNGQLLVKTEDYPFFFGNRYFLRRWIIQEISQAKVVHFCCEGYQFPMALLSGAIQKPTVGGNRASSPQGDQMMAANRAFQLCQIQAGPRPISMPLEELLYEHENAQCKEFQDKIYALLSLTTAGQQELQVDYDIDREQLMLSVLHFCAAYEDLSPFRVLSYMIFLYQHLKADSEKLYATVIDGRAPQSQYTFIVRGIVRGHVEQLQCSTDIEAAAVEIRKGLPTLRKRLSIPLMTSQQLADGVLAAEPWLVWDNELLAMPAPSSATGISGTDLCLFTFHSYASADELATTPLTVAFASTPVAVGDQIWQFERTPLAVLARRTSRGCALVGRVILLRELKNTSRWPPSKIEHELRWVKSGMLHEYSTPYIGLGWKELYEFATWVNFDS